MADLASHDYETNEPSADSNGSAKAFGAAPVEHPTDLTEPQPGPQSDESRAQVDSVLQSDASYFETLCSMMIVLTGLLDWRQYPPDSPKTERRIRKGRL
jgi:hypothetical protein